MKQKAIAILTWAVVAVAVLSSVRLASQVPLIDARLELALESEEDGMPLPSEPTAAGPPSSAPNSGRTASR